MINEAAWLELRLALFGALRLALGDRRGIACFDTSLAGFWRSFRAAVIAYPLFLGLRLADADAQTAPVVPFVLINTIAYVIGWTALPLAVLPLSRWIDREDRFLGFMVVYNWSQLPQYVVLALCGLVPGTTGDLTTQLVVLAALIYEWYIARVTLNTTVAAAIVIVLLDLVITALIGRVAGLLY